MEAVIRPQIAMPNVSWYNESTLKIRSVVWVTAIYDERDPYRLGRRPQTSVILVNKSRGPALGYMFGIGRK